MREGGREGGGEFFFFKLKLGFGLVRTYDKINHSREQISYLY